MAGFTVEPSEKTSLALEKYDQRTINISAQELKSVVVLDFLGQLSHFSTHCLAYRDLSSRGDATEAARGLFSSLRWAELQPGAVQVFVAPVITTLDVNEEVDSTSWSEEALANKENYDLFFGLSDRIFRATSGVAMQVVLE